MKNIIWQNPNKMLIETGHKTFDHQTNLITSGNVWGNTQFSNCVRGWYDQGLTENKRQNGQLTTFDLKAFKNMPKHIYSEAVELSKKSSFILYKFFHYNGDNQIVHGYVATNYIDDKLLKTWYTPATYKSYDVVDECVKYITN